MPGSLKTEAIVLRSMRYGEADRILHLFTCFWASLYTWMNPAWPVTVVGREKIARDAERQCAGDRLGLGKRPHHACRGRQLSRRCGAGAQATRLRPGP